jgi:hypothetical protein
VDALHASGCIGALVHSPPYGRLSATFSDKDLDNPAGDGKETYRERIRLGCVRLIAEKEKGGKSLADAPRVKPAEITIPPNTFPDIVKKILTKADTIELLSLDPGLPGQDPPKGKKQFHGWKILGSTKVTGKDTRKKLIDEINTNVEKSNELYKASCFFPRHGIRASSEGKTIELVICFECGRIPCYYEGKQIKEVATMKAPEKLLDEVLKAAKVPLAPKPKFSEVEQLPPPQVEK